MKRGVFTSQLSQKTAAELADVAVEDATSYEERIVASANVLVNAGYGTATYITSHLSGSTSWGFAGNFVTVTKENCIK